MPYDSNGNFTLTSGYLAVAGQVIQPSNIIPSWRTVSASGPVPRSPSRDGRAPMTGTLNMNSFKVINLLAGSSALDAVNKTQLDAVDTECEGNCRYCWGMPPYAPRRHIFFFPCFNGRRLTINGTPELIPLRRHHLCAIRPDAGYSLLHLRLYELRHDDAGGIHNGLRGGCNNRCSDQEQAMRHARSWVWCARKQVRYSPIHWRSDSSARGTMTLGSHCKTTSRLTGQHRRLTRRRRK